MAASVGGGALLVAWLAAANTTWQDAAPTAPPAILQDEMAVPRALAVDVEAEGRRLHDRLSQAPTPTRGTRNPFAFDVKPASRAPRGAEPIAAAAAAPTDAETSPTLLLVGVAEEPSPEGLHRTAILSGPGGAVYMVMEGQSFAGRYRVRKIGADAVELQDLLTSGFRRLAIR
jgi:hypothetical protein